MQTKRLTAYYSLIASFCFNISTATGNPAPVTPETEPFIKPEEDPVVAGTSYEHEAKVIKKEPYCPADEASSSSNLEDGSIKKGKIEPFTAASSSKSEAGKKRNQEQAFDIPWKLRRFPMFRFISRFEFEVAAGKLCAELCEEATAVFAAEHERQTDKCQVPGLICYGRMMAITINEYNLYSDRPRRETKLLPNTRGHDRPLSNSFQVMPCAHYDKMQVCPGHPGISSCRCHVELYMLTYKFDPCPWPKWFFGEMGDCWDLQMCKRLKSMAPPWECDEALARKRVDRPEESWSSDDDDDDDDSDALKCNCNGGYNTCKIMKSRSESLFQHFDSHLDATQVFWEETDRRVPDDWTHPSFI